jgi:hypothetical protein
MMNTLVGLICGASTGRVYAIINPDEDSELENPRWLLIKVMAEMREPLTLAKVPLADYMACQNPEAIEALARNQLGYKPD